MLMNLSLVLEDSIPSHKKALTRYCAIYILQQGGINQVNFASRSFRIAALTTATATGIPAWLIKTLGRWNSDAYLTYIQCPNEVLPAVPHILSTADATNQPLWDPDS